MEKIKNILIKIKDLIKSKPIPFIVALVIIVLVITYCALVFSESNKTKKLELGNKLYNEVYNLYSKGEGIKYLKDKSGNEIIKENKKITSLGYEITENYYAIDFDDLKEKLTNHELKDFEKEKNLIKENDKYFVIPITNMETDYLSTTLEIKTIGLFKVKFKARVKYCEADYRVSYGTGCSSLEHIKEKEDTFVIKYSGGKWKVDLYNHPKEYEKKD